MLLDSVAEFKPVHSKVQKALEDKIVTSRIQAKLNIMFSAEQRIQMSDCNWSVESNTPTYSSFSPTSLDFKALRAIQENKTMISKRRLEAKDPFNISPTKLKPFGLKLQELEAPVESASKPTSLSYREQKPSEN